MRLVERELARGRAARREGNEGKVRVCARRAAGAAIAYWMRGEGGIQPPDAVGYLRALAEMPPVPAPVRDAARRLSARISDQFTWKFATDPLEDSAIITTYVLKGPPA